MSNKKESKAKPKAKSRNDKTAGKKGKAPADDSKAVEPAVDVGAEANVRIAAEPAADDGPEDTRKREDLENRYLRLQADFDNYRKRAVREKGELWQRAHAEVIEELLPVLDHMDLAIEAAVKHQADAAFMEGFRLVRDQLRATLGKYGLEAQDVEGQPFDPNAHEAVMHVPSADVADHHVVQEVRKGYTLKGQLLRPAQVVVSSGPAEEEAQTAEKGE